MSKQRFQIPRGLSDELVYQAIETEFEFIWERLNQMSKNWKSDPPEICSCDITYTGAHRIDCPFKRGGC